MITKTRILIGTAAAAILVLGNSAMATTSFTTVNAPPSGEKNHKQILGQIYGGSFWGTGNGRDYSNGNISAMRLADRGAPTPTNLTSGVAAGDSFWTATSGVQLVAKAKYAADNSIFGWIDDSEGSGGTFQSIFNTSNLNAPASIVANGNFRWALKDLSVNRTYTSDPSTNEGAGQWCNQFFDQLVTYKITRCDNNGTVCEYVLFWEDRIKGLSADYDYNDAVIVVEACAIPSPAAGGLAALGGLMALRRRRR